MIKRSLTEEEKLDLKNQHKKERDGKIRDRIKAVLLHDSGWTLEKIAEALLLSCEGIRKHIEDYFYENKLAPTFLGSKCAFK